MVRVIPDGVKTVVPYIACDEVCLARSTWSGDPDNWSGASLVKGLEKPSTWIVSGDLRNGDLGESR